MAMMRINLSINACTVIKTLMIVRISYEARKYSHGFMILKFEIRPR